MLGDLASDLAFGLTALRAHFDRDRARQDLEQKTAQLRTLAAELVHVEQREISRLKDQQLQIVVSDQGVGFDPAILRPPAGVAGGIGLFGLRERLALLGGQLDVQSTPGQGSRFTLLVPARPGLRANGPG